MGFTILLIIYAVFENAWLGLTGKNSNVRMMDPAKIRYSQESISFRWSDYSKYEDTIYDTLDELKSGEISLDDFPPIRVYRHANEWWTLDHRRLWVFKEYRLWVLSNRGARIPNNGEYRVRVEEVNAIQDFNRKRTTQTYGEYIYVKEDSWYHHPVVR